MRQSKGKTLTPPRMLTARLLHLRMLKRSHFRPKVSANSYCRLNINVTQTHKGSPSFKQVGARLSARHGASGSRRTGLGPELGDCYRKWPTATGSRQRLLEVGDCYWKWPTATGSGQRLLEVDGCYRKWPTAIRSGRLLPEMRVAGAVAESVEYWSHVWEIVGSNSGRVKPIDN